MRIICFFGRVVKRKTSDWAHLMNESCNFLQLSVRSRTRVSIGFSGHSGIRAVEQRLEREERPIVRRCDDALSPTTFVDSVDWQSLNLHPR